MTEKMFIDEIEDMFDVLRDMKLSDSFTTTQADQTFAGFQTWIAANGLNPYQLEGRKTMILSLFYSSMILKMSAPQGEFEAPSTVLAVVAARFADMPFDEMVRNDEDDPGEAKEFKVSRWFSKLAIGMSSFNAAVNTAIIQASRLALH